MSRETVWQTFLASLNVAIEFMRRLVPDELLIALGIITAIAAASLLISRSIRRP